jgi:hypothetical protein
MATFLTYLNVGLVVNVLVFALTLTFSTKIKDFFKGIPADVRTGLNTVEADVVAKVKAGKADVIAKALPAVAKPTITVAVIPTGVSGPTGPNA